MRERNIMVINFDEIKEQILPEFFGGMKQMNTHMYTDDANKIFTASLEPGASIGEHLHDGTSEIIYILKGSGIGTVDGQETQVKPGMCQYCRSGHTHSLVNTGDETLEFFAVVAKQQL